MRPDTPSDGVGRRHGDITVSRVVLNSVVGIIVSWLTGVYKSFIIAGCHDCPITAHVSRVQTKYSHSLQHRRLTVVLTGHHGDEELRREVVVVVEDAAHPVEGQVVQRPGQHQPVTGVRQVRLTHWER